jgi:hypothetical protein
MTSSPRFDISGHQGSEIYLQFTLKQKDSSGNITTMDLTNKTLNGQVRSTYDNNIAYNFDCSIADAENGQVVVYMGGDTTSTMPRGPLVYDLELVDNLNPRNVIKPMWGNLFMKPEATR